MRGRGKVGGKAAKTSGRRKSLLLKQRNKSARRIDSSMNSQETEAVRLACELSEALERQKATSEVLRVISNSPAELEPVFNSMLENAIRICAAKFGVMYHYEKGLFEPVAKYGVPNKVSDYLAKRGTFEPHAGSPLAEIIRTKRPVNISDITKQPVTAPRAATIGGAHSFLCVPMFKTNVLVGAIVIYSQEVRPFTASQIELLQNFASQAVIAIENARLVNELQESLEQQTSTSEVLKIVASSIGELASVFEAVLANATRLCDASNGNMFLCENDEFRTAAFYGPRPTAFIEQYRIGTLFRPGLELPALRAVKTRQPVHVINLATSQAYLDKDPLAIAGVDVAGIRTLLAVPMLREDEPLGVITIFRKVVRAFTDKQIALVQHFAAQAAIAIENTRLLNELRGSLERQTATSEVLRVISSSPGNLQPVFETMLANAVHICEAKFGQMFVFESGAFRPAAAFKIPAALLEVFRRRGTFIPRAGSTLAELMRINDVVHVPDLLAEGALLSVTAEYGGARAYLGVPMLKDSVLIGAIVLYRQEVRPFTAKQIELVTNFAAQAVIAIENARLLKELRERTDQLETQSREVTKLNRELERRVANQVGEIERMSRLRRFLPPQVADLIVASGTEKQLESHRREITALFCDLRGFTGFSESSEPEDVMALLGDYHAAIGQIIIKYSGTLERYAGDGVMVVFNDPVPVANPTLQAVLMALELRNAIGSLTESWRRWGHDIGFGIGIAHGFATLGTIGFEGRFDYAAIGTVSNVASRLCDEAKPGQILISPRVLTKVENAVTVEPVGEFALKGIRRPLTAYNVLSARSAS